MGEDFFETSTFGFFADMYIDNLHLHSSHGGKINYDIFSLLKPYKNEIYNSLYDMIEQRIRHNEECGWNSPTTEEYFNEYYAKFFNYMDGLSI